MTSLCKPLVAVWQLQIRGGKTFYAGDTLRLARGCGSLAEMFELEGIDHVALSVRDVERAAAWYIEVLGFERRYEEMWDGVPLFIAKGNTALALFPARQNAQPSSGRPDRIGMLHLALRTSRKEFAAAQRDLRARGITFDFQDHEISHSIYFDDPDGNRLEITTYEMSD